MIIGLLAILALGAISFAIMRRRRASERQEPLESPDIVGTLSQWGVGEADRKLLSAIDTSPERKFFMDKGFVHYGCTDRVGPVINFYDRIYRIHVFYYHPKEKGFYLVNPHYGSKVHDKKEYATYKETIRIKVTDPEALADAIREHINWEEEERKSDSLGNIILGTKNDNHDNV